jgi:CHAT domain
MSLPRIFITVSSSAGGANCPGCLDGGWAVNVTAANDDSPILAPYHMCSAKVEVSDRVLRVPFVPPLRRNAYAAGLDALCAGDKDAIGLLLTRLAAERLQGDDALVYGRWLFECLLAPAWPLVRGNPDLTAARGMELALAWDADHADLHSLVWEAMYDDQDRPLAGLQDRLVVVTRVVHVGYPERGTIECVPKVLFASGTSLTDEVIRPAAMFMGLLRKFDAEGICVTRAVQDVSLSDLQQECQAFSPDVVHLVAHGETRPDGSGVLLLGSREAGGGVGAAQLLQALTVGKTPMAVVLSACHSGGGLGGPGAADDQAENPVNWRAAPLAAELVAGGIPIVTAMAGAVSEPACRMYTTRLVDAIHQGKPLGRAAAEGRAAALAGAPKPTQQLDWAMPTIFLASSVQPDFRPLNPAVVDRLVGLADSLKLRKAPVFIGRQNILRAIDDLFPEGIGGTTGFVAVCSSGRLDKLGSTRLLEEIGFRLLRAGHVPLLLANYSEVGFAAVASGVPPTLRVVVAEILRQAIEVADKVGLRPPRLRVLGVDPSFAADAAVTGVGLADKDPWQARQDARNALVAFRQQSQALDPDLVRAPLAADLAELASIVAHAGEPFGSRTRVVVLADRVHQWTGALGPLLAMVESTGLGRDECPVPVVVTASLGGAGGQTLQMFLDDNLGAPWLKLYELTTLTTEEATLGFQWVLLSQWHPKERYKRVYVAARTTPQSLARDILSELDGEPASVRLSLYQVIRSHLAAGEFVEHDDLAAFDRYTRLHS